MSSTRRAKEGSRLRQERYLSSPEFERGLKALPVARRCELLTNPQDREIIWWLQAKSYEGGELGSVAAELCRLNPDSVCTPSMHRFGLNPAQRYDAKQVKAVRDELPAETALWAVLGKPTHPVFPLRNEWGEWNPDACDLEYHLKMKGESAGHPDTYPASALLQICHNGASDLGKHLESLCLDPATSLTKDPWYFVGLREALLALMKLEAQREASSQVVTEVGRRVHACLDRARKSRRIVVVNGVPRIGKSHAAQSWVKQNAGRARLVEVPTGNDDISFFRAVAGGLGMGSFMSYKATEIRARIETVLVTGQLLLALDEGKRLWPQRNLRYGYPSRIEWIMSLINRGAHICIITTPEFFAWQQRVEQSSCWQSGQLIGRISRHEMLPGTLKDSDLEAVARRVLPEADETVIQSLVDYAAASARYLAAIEDIADDARYIAESEGRDTVRRSDIQRAMREGVIPSDRSLAKTIQATAPKRVKQPLMPVQGPVFPALSEAPEEQESPARGREISPVQPGRSVRPVADLAKA